MSKGHIVALVIRDNFKRQYNPGSLVFNQKNQIDAFDIKLSIKDYKSSFSSLRESEGPTDEALEESPS